MVQDKKIVASIEARMTSSRLPGKVLLPLGGKPALQFMIERVLDSELIDDIIVATTVNETDNPIVELCQQIDVPYYRGSEDDVLNRVWKAHQKMNSDIICELTGDCPLIDPEVIDHTISYFLSNSFDYVSNCHDAGVDNFYRSEFAKGMDVEVFSRSSFDKLSQMSLSPEDREHVSLPFLFNSEFSVGRVSCPPKWRSEFLEVTLDEAKDYEFLQRVVASCEKENPYFGLIDIIQFVKANPDVLAILDGVKRKLV